DSAGLGAAARAGAELDGLGAQLLLVERGDLLDGLRRQVDDALDELVAVAAAVLDVRETLLPVAGQLGRGERMLLEHGDHLQALRGRLKLLAGALDVLPADQHFDRLGAGRRRAETGVLHGFAELLVVDPLAGGLHRREQRRLGVAGRRLRLLVLELGLDALDGLTLLELRQLGALVRGFLVLGRTGLLVEIGLEAVDAAPARLEGDLAAGAKALVLDERHHLGALVARRRMEDGEEATGNQVEDAPLVRGEAVDGMLDVGRDDRVVVVDPRVVDDALQRQPVEREHVARGRGVVADWNQRLGGRLQERHHVTRQVARARSRIRNRLLVLVERLRGLESAPRGETEAAVRVALERCQVVEQRRALGLLLLLHLLDGAVLAGHLLGDLLRPREIAEDPRLVALEPHALVTRIKPGADETVRLRRERLDLALALDHHRQRRGLYTAERDDSTHPGAAADGRGAG